MAGTLNFLKIEDALTPFNVNLRTYNTLNMGDIDIGGDLHVMTNSGGVSQVAGRSLNIGGRSNFTADTGTNQVAVLTSPNNIFAGLVTLDQVSGGSWANVSVTASSSLSLGPLQSAGAVNLQTHGSLITSSMAVTGSLTVSSNGGAVSLGETSVSGDMTIQTNGGNLSQTGQFTVGMNTTVSTVSSTQGAPSGTISLDYVSYDLTQNPPALISNSFAGTLSLSGNSTAIATSGNLRLASVTNTGPMTLRAPSGSIDLGAAFITGGDLTLQSRDNLNLGGANISGDLNMSSTQGTVSFGSATVNGNLTASTIGQQVDLGTANVGGNLSVQTQGGNIVQSTSAGSFLHVTGTSNLNAGTGNVNLPNVPNEFGAAVSMQAQDAVLVGSNGLILGNSNIAGNLSVTAVTGNVTQSSIGALSVSGASSFTATHGDVLLTSANTLIQSVTLDAMNATIHTASALTLAASTVTSNLNVIADIGDITQTGPLTVTGTSNLNAVAGNIALTDVANSFGDRVSVTTPQALQLTSSGALSMGIVNVGLTTDLQSHGVLDLGVQSVYTGKLKANSGGFEIMQTGPLKAGAATDFDAGNAKI